MLENEFAVVTRYDPKTGRLMEVRNGTWGSVLAMPMSFVRGQYDLELEYVDLKTREVLRRPQFEIIQSKEKILATGEDFVIFRGFPAGTQITVDDTAYTASDGVLEYATTLPGEHHVIFDLWPYLPVDLVVIAE